MFVDAPDAPARILKAAAEVFSRRGFKAATVREICRLAGVGLGSVNYHFRDKDGLYFSVMENLLATGLARYPVDMGLPPGATLEERLRAFIRSFLLRLAGGDEEKNFPSRLVVRELADPSPAMDALVECYIRPQKETLFRIVQEWLGPDVPPEKHRRCAMSIVGQCLYYVYARPVYERLELDVPTGVSGNEEIADHIAQFSIAGLERVRMQGAIS
jgi:AcrR family transcriptional regulator